MTSSDDTGSSARLEGVRVLVTGGAGFIGSNLVRRLISLGAYVLVVDCFSEGSGANTANLVDVTDNIRLINADIFDREAYAAALVGVGYVFHLAAQTGHIDSIKNPLTDLSVNAMGTLSLLEAIRVACPNAYVVFASTRQVYGVPVKLPVAEDHPVHPPDVNAVGKVCAEELLRVYQRVHGIRSVTLRLTNTYGPRMRIRDGRQMFLGLWIRGAIEGTKLRVFGDGKQRRDFVYVDDVVDALLKATDVSLNGRIFNVGSDESLALGVVANLMSKWGEGAPEVELVDFPLDRKVIDIGDFVGDYRAFRKATGWHAPTAFSDGMKRTIKYFMPRLTDYLE